MATLAIINPATGGQIDEVPADDAATVALKAAQARAAQPRWHTIAQQPKPSQTIRIERRFPWPPMKPNARTPTG